MRIVFLLFIAVCVVGCNTRDTKEANRSNDSGNDSLLKPDRLSDTSVYDSTKIYFFTTANDGYIKYNLSARYRNKVYVLIDSSEGTCLSIEHVGDYNNDGYSDALIKLISGCGGNCCGNSFMIVCFDGNAFVRTQSVGDDWDDIKIDSTNGIYTFGIETLYEGYTTELKAPKTELFQLKKYTLTCIRSSQPAFIPALKEIRSSDFEKNDTSRYFLYDLNSNKRMDTIIYRPWERWGRLFWEIHFDNGIQYSSEESPKRIGILSSMHHGYRDLVLDIDQVLIWNGKEYQSREK